MRDCVDDLTKGQVAEFAEVVHFRDPGKAAATCARLWNVKSSTETRKVVRHVSGRRRVHSPGCRARFQDIVDTEAAQTAAASARANQLWRPQDRQRVAPRPVEAAAQHRLRVAPAAGGCQHGKQAENSAAQPTSSAVGDLRTMEVQNVRV